MSTTKKNVPMFYCDFIESVLTFCIICWFSKATEAQKKEKRKKTETTSSKLLVVTSLSMEHMYRYRTMKKANNIVGGQRQPLASSFELLPSGRRYCPPLFIKNRSKFSFVPQAIKFLNS